MTRLAWFGKVCILFINKLRAVVVTEQSTGTVTLSDESGRKRTLGPGDSFFIHRGSTVKFSSENYGVCFKCAARPRGKL